MSTDAHSATEQQCRCGHQRNDKIIAPMARYGGVRWLLFVIGVTPTPSRIDFTCPSCGHVFETSTDPEVLLRYKFRSA